MTALTPSQVTGGSRPKASVTVPLPQKVRSALPEARHERSTWKGLAIFAINAVLVAALFGTAIISASFWISLSATLGLGIVIGTLFVVGHDACHEALFDRLWLNRCVGTLAFLPSFHLYSTWALGHNRHHHGWTMLRGKDYVYPPLTSGEYSRLGTLRRWIWRFFHTLPGIGFYYLVEVWWKHLVLRQDASDREMSGAEYRRDLALVCGFAALVIAGGTGIAISSGQSAGIALVHALLVVAGSFLVFNWIMAFVTIQHHRHPRARWYASRDEWDFYKGQVCGTVHLHMPRLIEFFFGNILEHTAHHVDKKVPMYRLRESQAALEAAFGPDVIVEKFSLGYLVRLLRECQLYDYEKHKWMRFKSVHSGWSARAKQSNYECSRRG
jgi:omega-6 fatty acid desaturase (delta-12 desaturase)